MFQSKTALIVVLEKTGCSVHLEVKEPVQKGIAG